MTTPLPIETHGFVYPVKAFGLLAPEVNYLVFQSFDLDLVKVILETHGSH